MLETVENALQLILKMWDTDLGTLYAGLTAFTCSIYLFCRLCYGKK